MIELAHLVNAVILLAVVLRPFLEWVQFVEFKREIDRAEAEWGRRMLDENLRFRYSLDGRHPNAHAILTGITS